MQNSVFAYCNELMSYIVIDGKTGQILEQDKDKNLKHPASLTKIMTLYLTFEALKNGDITMDTQIEVSDSIASQPKFNANLKEGEFISVRDAILGVIVKSFNDVNFSKPFRSEASTLYKVNLFSFFILLYWFMFIFVLLLQRMVSSHKLVRLFSEDIDESFNPYIDKFSKFFKLFKSSKFVALSLEYILNDSSVNCGNKYNVDVSHFPLKYKYLRFFSSLRHEKSTVS